MGLKSRRSSTTAGRTPHRTHGRAAASCAWLRIAAGLLRLHFLSDRPLSDRQHRLILSRHKQDSLGTPQPSTRESPRRWGSPQFPVGVRPRLPTQILAPNPPLALIPHVSALPRLPASFYCGAFSRGHTSDDL